MNKSIDSNFRAVSFACGVVFAGYVAAAGGTAAYAQTQAATIAVHGHVQNPAGVALTAGDVKFTKDKNVEEKDQKFSYSFPIDNSGDYKGAIAPGAYYAYVIVDGKRPDRSEVTLKFGDPDKTLDFDMTRKEYMDAMSPADKAALEAYKKNAGATMNANKVIAELNNTLKTVRGDMSAAASTHGDVSKDVGMMQQATTAKPDEGLLWITYGDTLQGQGDHLAQVDKDAKKSWQTDADVTKEYSDAVDAYKKGIDLNAASKKPTPNDQAVAYNQMGNLLAKLNKPTDAVAAFDQAAKLDPTKAGMYYGNEAANLFNSGATTEAAAAAAKAIAVDPTRPDPYFIEGQALITQATVDKAGKITAPPACIEAYQKYLELAPDGKFAGQVKEILAGMGQTVTTKYKAGKK